MIRNPALTLTLAATLALSACGGDDPTTQTPSSSPPASSTSAGATSPTETSFAGTEVVVAVKDGKVVPSTHRVKVAKGTEVRLLITSDTADEVHVHGYEIEEELPAGQQATVDFTADQTGLFEVETHERGLQLLQLEVR